ncbi:MAG: NAD(P)-dependent glycerol-3-phosphate dehydrogenase [Gammaproteobacteria bacterium]|nr:NAD(P)-dependent glycerol-3-phosphate dehydrogenase [Gammaproteobacteria bacterium]
MAEAPILVMGAGAWGTALAAVCARAGREVCLYDTDAATIEALRATHHHPRFAPEVELPAGITPVASLAGLPVPAFALMVVPYQVMRGALEALRPMLPALQAVACASKGFELDTGMMAHEIVAAVLGTELPFAQVSGPNFAVEILRGSPAAITVGASDAALGQRIVAAMHGPAFRPYYTDDVLGVEVGGALKNVIAIAAGIADGLGLGANTRAALITRGLAEIARFGMARGGRRETFMGLSGMGDLVLTCTDDQSRNRRFGKALAASGSVSAAQAEVGALVEGVATARAIAALARQSGVEMPIVTEVTRVLNGETSPTDAVRRLLARDPTAETGA